MILLLNILTNCAFCFFLKFPIKMHKMPVNININKRIIIIVAENYRLYLWPWAHVSHFPAKAFFQRVEANAGESKTSFLMVLLEWKFSRRCSSSPSSPSSCLGWATKEAMASCKASRFVSNVWRRMSLAPPVAT